MKYFIIFKISHKTFVNNLAIYEKDLEFYWYYYEGVLKTFSYLSTYFTDCNRDHNHYEYHNLFHDFIYALPGLHAVLNL